MDENKMKYDLVLLDSGYNFKSFIWKSEVDVYIREKTDKWIIKQDTLDDVGHGTAVLSIVLNGYEGKYAVFKAFTSMTMSNSDNVISALEYIYHHISCKYIQMSFGIRGYNSELEKVCRKLYEDKGIIIIAAFDNCGAISYPAAFEFVIGVSGDPFIKKKDEFKINSSNGILDIYAKSGLQAVAQTGKKGFTAEQGNSFAASYISLALLLAKQVFTSKEDAMKFFCSDYRITRTEPDNRIFGKNAAIFPLNKEMYSLINYANMLKVQLTDVYDIKYAGNLGKELHSFVGENTYIVKNIEKCEWENFDTLIIGHVREMSKLLKKNIKRELLNACLIHHKNVYCYDRYELEDFRELFAQNGLILDCADDYCVSDKNGKLFQLKTPILAVLGTSKKQGKFTLQMQIKRVLEEKNINLGILGTEPNSLLLGCDKVLPLGYDSKMSSKSGRYIIEAFNEKMHEIDILDKDIILVGGQSGFLPPITFNVGHININQISFLFGIMPDGVVLSVNDTDSIDYIKKSICAIERDRRAHV